MGRAPVARVLSWGMPHLSSRRTVQASRAGWRPQSRAAALGELVLGGLALGLGGAVLAVLVGVVWHGAHWPVVSGALNTAGIVLVCVGGSFVLAGSQPGVAGPVRTGPSALPWRSVLTCLVAGGLCFLLDAALRATPLA